MLRRTLTTSARALAEPADKAAALGFSAVKRQRALPSLDIPQSANADIQRTGDSRPGRGDRRERQPNAAARYPRAQGDRPPRAQGDRPPRQHGDRPMQARGDRPPRQQGDRHPRQQGDRAARPHRREAQAGKPAAPPPSSVEAREQRAKAPESSFFEGIELAASDAEAEKAARAAQRGARRDAKRAEKLKNARPPAARRQSARFEPKPVKELLFVTRPTGYASVATVPAPTPGSAFALFGRESVLKPTHMGASNPEATYLARKKGLDAQAARKADVLRRAGDYTLFLPQLPQTIAGPKGAVQRAIWELHTNKSVSMRKADKAEQLIKAFIG